jgi:biotin synthase
MSQSASGVVDMETPSGEAVDSFSDKLSSLGADFRRWDVRRIEALLDLPFSDLIHRAQQVHRQYHDPNFPH